MSQFFFNQRASLVNDVIEGTIIASPWNNLARLESDPAIRVVVRRDLNKNNVAVIAGGNKAYIAHVGDSRAYLLRDGTLSQVTTDHTVVHMLLENGQITEDEIETHPQRHMLMKAVGVERTVCPDYFRIDLQPDQPFCLLLCSDGLCGFCSDAEIQEILERGTSAEEMTQQLVDAALEKGGRDNISVAVVTAS